MHLFAHYYTPPERTPVTLHYFSSLIRVSINKMERSNWKKVFSNSKKRYYWFNEATGKTQWDEPEVHLREPMLVKTVEVIDNTSRSSDVNDKKRKVEEDDVSAHKTSKTTSQETTTSTELPSETAPQLPKIAIIVPFRDLHVEQKRAEHLKRFIPEMARCVLFQRCIFI